VSFKINNGGKNKKKFETMKKIIANAELRKKMMDVFRVSNQNVGQALSYQRHSRKAKLMRVYALANGGVKLESADEHSDND